MRTEVATFLRSLSQQRRVIGALLLRELITRFGRENLGVLWLVGEPMIFTVAVATLWTTSGLTHASSVPIVAFAVTGYSSVLMWRNSASHCCSAVEANKNLLHHRGVTILDTLFARMALEISGATGSFIVLSLFFSYIGWMSPPADLLLVIGGWLMLAWFGASLALLVGAGVAFSRVVERFWWPIAYVLFPTSGAAFMVDWLPLKLQRLVMYLPMVHGVEMLRQGYFGNVVRTHYDVGYMATCCLVLSLSGFYVVRLASRRVEL
jgi:capsular polysaccharide transport system permease protein